MLRLILIEHLAKAYNTLDHSILEDIIDDDIVYESQMVLEPITDKQNFMEYVRDKFEAIKNSGRVIFAEIGYIGIGNQYHTNVKLLLEDDIPCLIMAQGTKNEKQALLLIELKGNRIGRIDICSHLPHWSQAIRTSEYPGLSAAI